MKTILSSLEIPLNTKAHILIFSKQKLKDFCFRVQKEEISSILENFSKIEIAGLPHKSLGVSINLSKMIISKSEDWLLVFSMNFL